MKGSVEYIILNHEGNLHLLTSSWGDKKSLQQQLYVQCVCYSLQPSLQISFKFIETLKKLPTFSNFATIWANNVNYLQAKAYR